MDRHHKDVLTRHRQQSWYIPGVIVRKIGQDLYAVQVGDNKVQNRDHTELRPRAPDPSGRAVTFEFKAGDLDSGDDGGEDDYTAERILTDQQDPAMPGERLYKVCWRNVLLCVTRGSVQGVLCPGIPQFGWTISRKRE